LYCIFLGALIVLFVAWAVSALYPRPTWETEHPDMPDYVSPPSQPATTELSGLTPAEKKAKFQTYGAQKKKYDADQKQREKLRKALTAKTETHDRNVSLLSLVVAVVVMALGVGLASSLPVIAEGLLLGGLFILVYSIGWSFITSPKIAVIPVGVGLIVTIALGYKRFVKAPRLIQ
jgi:hypothetical protein